MSLGDNLPLSWSHYWLYRKCKLRQFNVKTVVTLPSDLFYFVQKNIFLLFEQGAYAVERTCEDHIGTEKIYCLYPRLCFKRVKGIARISSKWGGARCLVCDIYLIYIYILILIYIYSFHKYLSWYLYILYIHIKKLFMKCRRFCYDFLCILIYMYIYTHINICDENFYTSEDTVETFLFLLANASMFMYRLSAW